MAYESPITLFMSEVEYKLTEEVDATTLKAVQKCFPYVDRDELLKALEYDRGQYEAGYADGHAARDAEIVRCKDCRWGREACGNIECFVDSNIPPEYHGYEWFCPNGERSDDGRFD